MADQYYCSPEDVYPGMMSMDKAVKLTDGVGGVVNQENFDAARKTATNTVISYILSRFSDSMPFTEVPGILSDIAASLTVYFLHSRKSAVSDHLELSYKHQISQLSDIRDGKQSIGIGEKKIKLNSVRFTKKSPDDRLFKMEMPGY